MRMYEAMAGAGGGDSLKSKNLRMARGREVGQMTKTRWCEAGKKLEKHGIQKPLRRECFQKNWLLTIAWPSSSGVKDRLEFLLIPVLGGETGFYPIF